MPAATEETKTISMNKDELELFIQETHKKLSTGKVFVKEEDILKDFSKLPEEYEREYEKTICSFADNWQKNSIEGPLTELMEKIKNDACTPESAKNAFHAFAVIVNYHRLQKNFDTEESLIEAYRQYFQGKHIFFDHLDLLSRLDGILESSEEELKEILALAKKNSLQLKKNCGGHHAYAETIAIIYEDETLSCGKYLTESRPVLMRDADRAIREAQRLDPNYAKFYCTEGRLLALNENLDEAIKKVSTAIATENDSRKDYAIRISQYTGILQQFRSKQNTTSQMTTMAHALEDHKKNMDEQKQSILTAMEEQEKQSMVKNMEFLGLFSGIVSFTIGSLTITGAIADQSIQSAAGLIVVLMGALIGVFAAFGIVLHGIVKKKEAGRNINDSKLTALFQNAAP